MSERGVPPSPRKYSGAVYCTVPRMSSALVGGAASATPATRIEPKSMIFTVPVLSIMMLSGRRSWCSISRRWKALQALGDLLDDAAHRFEVGLRIVDHPLRQRLPVDEFGRRHRGSCALAAARSGLSTCGLSMRRATHSSIRKRSR